MNPPKDTELRERWKTVQESLARIKGRYNQASNKERSALHEEERIIKSQWNELFAQKLRGVLTDRSFVDVVIKAAKELAIVHGISVQIEEKEGPCDSAVIPRW